MPMKDNKFIGACDAGSLADVQALFAQARPNDRERGFCLACARGHMAVARWLKSACPRICAYYETNRNAFAAACEHGHLELARWLLDELDPPPQLIDGIVFYAVDSAIKNDRVAAVGWLLDALSAYDGGFGIVAYAETLMSEHAFAEACARGHQELAQKMFHAVIESYHQRRQNIIDLPLRRSCEQGALAAVQWLVRRALADGNLRPDKYSAAFIAACRCGRPAVAQWMFEAAGGLLRHEVGSALQAACERGHLGIAQWLAAAGDLDAQSITDALLAACSCVHLEVIKWLLFGHELVRGLE